MSLPINQSMSEALSKNRAGESTPKEGITIETAEQPTKSQVLALLETARAAGLIDNSLRYLTVNGRLAGIFTEGGIHDGS